MRRAMLKTMDWCSSIRLRKRLSSSSSLLVKWPLERMGEGRFAFPFTHLYERGSSAGGKKISRGVWGKGGAGEVESRRRSVRCWPLRSVDDERCNRSPRGLQSQAEFLLDSLKKRRTRGCP